MDHLVAPVLALLNHVENPYQVSEAAVTQMLAKWAANKEWLIAHFPADGRLTFPPASFDQFSDYRLNTMITNGEALQLWRDSYGGKFSHVAERGACDILSKARYSLSLAEVSTNLLSTDHVLNVFGQNNRYYKIVLPGQQRLGRALLQAVQQINLEDLGAATDEERLAVADAMVQTVSRYTQAYKAQAVDVTLSINPIDLLTMSWPTSGWHTCMGLSEGYNRALLQGWVMDSCTMIAYTSDRTQEVPNTSQVPVKKWRQLLHVEMENRRLGFSRHYPSHNVLNETAVQTGAATFFAQIFGTPAVKETLPEGSLLKVECVKPMYADSVEAVYSFGETSLDTRFKAGHSVLYCLDCGSEAEYEEDDRGHFLCDSCLRQQEKKRASA